MSSGASKVIVLEPDPRAGRLIQLGFEREGVPVLVPPLANGAVELPEIAEPPGLVVIGGGESAAAVDLVRRTKAWLAAKAADVPIVVAGPDPARGELAAAGADEIIARPVFLRDIVTIGRLLRGVPRDQRDHLAGSLVETTGVLTLVRALSALGRSAVLTLIRGLRRGEVRFFHGEVTSAQVGLIHGQAAFHQLLLWTDARFEFTHEDIVRRQQIPLSPEELFADAEQFLEGVREHSGQLSPSTVLEQNVQRIQQFGKQVPTEVHGILRMFDGHRVLADILEDSPYRVFETLRVTQKAVEIGLLRQVNAQRPKATWRAVLAIEEWLVGNETRDAVAERIASLDSGPVKAPPKKTKHKRKRRGPKKRESQPPPNELKGDIDWGALVPRMIGAELGPISGVVPAYEAHGEVELPTRDKPREGLEALMDTAKRQKIFPTEIGLEPSVVVAPEPGEDSDEWERAEWQAKQVALAQEKAVAEAKAAAERADAERRAETERRAEAERRGAAERADAEKRAAAAEAQRQRSEGAHAEQSADVDASAAAPASRRKRAAVERGEDVILEPAVPTPSEPTNTARHVAPPPPAASDLAEALAAAAENIASEPVPSPPQPASNTDRHAAPPPVTATAPAAPIAPAAAAASRANETARHAVPLRPPAQSPASGADAPTPTRHPTNGTAAAVGDTQSASDASLVATPASDAAAPATTGRAGETARHAIALRPPASTSTATPAPTSAASTPAAATATSSSTAASSTTASSTAASPTAASPTAVSSTAASSTAASPTATSPTATVAPAAPASTPFAAPLPPVVPSSASGAADVDPAAAGLVAVPTYVAPTKSDPVAAVTAVPADTTEPREIRPGATDARELVRGLVAEVVPPSETSVAKDARIVEPVTVAETPATTVAVTDVVTVSGSADTAVVTASPRMMISEQPAVTDLASTTPARTAATADAPAPSRTDAPAPSHANAPAPSHADAPAPSPVNAPAAAGGTASPAAISPIIHAPPAPANASIDAAHSAARAAAPIEPAFLAKAPAATASTAATSPDATAATPSTAATTSTAPTAATPSTAPTAATTSTSPTTPTAARDGATPEATEDEPSDGVVRATIASADTARVSRARMRPPTPEHDGPPIKQTTGEISQSARQQTAEPAVSEPSILVADLAAVHEAAAVAATKPADAPPPADAATPSRELEVAEVRRDALAFSEAEEAFFRGAEKTGTVPKVESFEDLDEGYQPPGFWDRVFGRKKPK